MNIVAWILQTSKALLAPAQCFFCRKNLQIYKPLCLVCSQRIRHIVPITLALTPSYQMSVMAMGAYENPLSLLIRAKHYQNDVAAYQLGQLMADYFAEWSFPCDYLVPVPLHWYRYALRGFNQADLIAQEVGKARNIPVVHLLRRNRHTALQVTRSVDQRQANVAGAFSVAYDVAQQYRGKHVVLVDDLMTTGATLRAAGRELVKLKPASISALVVCRT